MSHNALNRPATGVGRTARRVIVIVSAAVVNGMVWLGGQRAHVDYVVQTPVGARHIGVVLVIVATAISGLAGWAAFSLLERHASNPMRTWVGLAVAVVALSTVPVFVLPAHLGTRLTLTALHCLAAVILAVGLPQTQ